ncbi:Serine aminopeptidase, S33 [Teratosphaeria destructans]|uniref:Serine aminopeptidase, S33 n=1 Tax=Teratosphaeria destructans TaxID=418781 RepID=A0A9W7SQS3_9PEZI|nr:Serine aminopeptidase, S33 [Teratosphaeria destructans]
MAFPSWLQHVSTDLHDRRTLYIILTAPIIGFYAYRTITGLLNTTQGRNTAPIIPSPRKPLRLLSAEDLSQISYPPDALPGVRDVDTPYGNIRVYEWGPESGRKVLFIHGISTPCIAFASIAKMLVEQHGCRVMLFDLFGRGYSDAPDPEAFPQDLRLFTTQIMLVLGSSELAWTGREGRFALVGYSLGGGVAAGFTSYFPDMVDSLVLLAPGGLIRAKHISASSKLLYGGLLPKALVEYFIYRRIGGGKQPEARSKTRDHKTSGESETTLVEAAKSETPAHPALAKDSAAPLFPDRPSVSPAHAVGWQVDAHPGFLASFISSIQHAPITNQHERWRIIGRRLSAQKLLECHEGESAKKNGKVLVLLGETDSVIVPDETGEDAKEVLGEGNVDVQVLEGGHDFPVANAKGTVKAMVEFWDEESGRGLLRG